MRDDDSISSMSFEIQCKSSNCQLASIMNTSIVSKPFLSSSFRAALKTANQGPIHPMINTGLRPHQSQAPARGPHNKSPTHNIALQKAEIPWLKWQLLIIGQLQVKNQLYHFTIFLTSFHINICLLLIFAVPSDPEKNHKPRGKKPQWKQMNNYHLIHRKIHLNTFQWSDICQVGLKLGNEAICQFVV